MEFGVFHSAFVPAQPDPEAQRRVEHARLLEEVAVGEAADRAGFKYAWATEHHFLEEYSHLSASEVFLGFLAGRTERIHLGSGIFNLTPPVNHPARTAERVSMLDHLSGGRFELGTGRGSSSTEFQGFGIPDGATTRAMFDEVLPELFRMWSDEPYAHDGASFAMPERPVLPKPYSRPHPPVWVACGSPSTFRRAGELGLGALCFTLGTPEDLRPLIETYKEAIAGCTDPVGGFVNDNVACVTRLLCLEDADRAVDLVASSRPSYYQSLVFRYLDNVAKPDGLPEWPELIPEPTVAEVREVADLGLAAYGGPDECGRAVARWEEIGADQLIFSCLTTTLPLGVVEESLALFGERVIPAFDADPVHRTTRQREASVPAGGSR